MRVTRNSSPPKITVPVLYVPAAIEAFEQAVKQDVTYGEELIDGYIGASFVLQPQLMQTLYWLQQRGIVWLSPEIVAQTAPIAEHFARFT